MERYISAKEAAHILDVKPATLYAYVSRGLIRSESADAGNRERRYLAEDVHKLAQRKEQRRDPTKVAQDALNWGTPLLESAITLIDDDMLYYRGQSVHQLAQEKTFEQVATLLWTDSDDARLFELVETSTYTLPQNDLPAMQAMQVALTSASTHDYAAYNFSAESVAQTGVRILRLMTAVLTNNSHDISIAAALANAWCPEGERVLNAALILCADHELNASSFAARVAASVDATPYQVVIAGLATLQGAKHGGYTEQVTALFREVGEPAYARSVMGERLRRGETIPGFGHRLYTNGDPRAKTLFALLQHDFANSPAMALAETIAFEGQKLTGNPPTIDLALAAMELTLKLPRGAALAIFALGRTAGWIGHAIEQYTSRAIIRPRARYVGKLPNK